MSKLHRVYGPPGTGKTTYLTRQAEKASATYGREGVLIASLTKAAAAEAAGRTDLGRRQVGTLHSHAYRALGQPTIADAGEPAKAWNTEQGMQDGWRVGSSGADAEIDAGLGGLGGGAGVSDAIYAEYQRLRAADRPREVWPSRVLRFADAWETFKREHECSDFSDLIERASVETTTAPGDPAVILLDEAQDLSALEMRLADRWAETAQQVVIVGDPDQCLYTFRGSDPAVFGRGEAETERVLSQSYRVPRAVWERAVATIERIPDRKPVVYQPTDVEGFVRHCPLDVDQQAESLILEMLESDGKTAMLLTTCGYQLNAVIRVMRERGEPFWNPYRTTNGRWNPLRAGRRLTALRAWRAVEDGGAARPWTIDEVWAWLEPMKAKGLLQRGIKDYVQSLRALDEGMVGSREFPSASLEGIFVSRDDLEAATDGDLDWYMARLLPEHGKRLEYPARVVDKRGWQALTADPKIVVGTIHSVKGGEADEVWVAPDLSEQGWRSWSNDRASVLRLLYVAFTRARVGLHLTNPASARYVPFQEHRKGA